MQFRLGNLLREPGAQGRECIEGQIGVDGLGAIAGQDGEVVDLSGRPGLHHQARLGAQAHAHQMMMHGGGGQQGGDGDMVRIDIPVREHQDIVAVADRPLRRRAQQGHGGLHARGPLIHGVTDADGLGTEGPGGVILDMADAGQVRIRQDGVIHLQPQVVATIVDAQQIRARPDQGHQGHYQLLADGVDGRVGDLGEVLLEVVEQRLGLVRQDGDGVVGPHGPHRLLASGGHGRHQELEVFLGIAEGLLAVEEGLGTGGHGANVRG